MLSENELEPHNKPSALHECMGPFKASQAHYDNARLHRHPLSTAAVLQVDGQLSQKEILCFSGVLLFILSTMQMNFYSN